jgi:hypothetical protein
LAGIWISFDEVDPKMYNRQYIIKRRMSIMLQTVRRNVRAALRGDYPFIHGMSKSIDLGNTLVLKPSYRVNFIDEPLYGEVASDYDRIKSDWVAIGNDLYEAMRMVGENNVTRKSE